MTTVDPAPTVPQRVVLRNVLTLLACAAALVWSWRIAESVPQANDNPTWMFLAPLGLLVALLPHIVLHELAHLAVAVVLRLRVLGIKILWIGIGRVRTVPGTAGHVLVDVAHARKKAPVRMAATLVAGPLVNLFGAVGTAFVAGSSSVNTNVRYLAVGATVLGVMAGVTNLLPGLTTGKANDGPQAWTWLRRTEAQRARIQLAIDLATLRISSARTNPISDADRRRHIVEAVEDPRPELARAGMVELLRWRPRDDQGWQDVELVEAFAARRDLPTDVRARVSGNFSASLASAYLRSRSPRLAPDPTTDQARHIDRLADLAMAADPRSVSAKTARGLAHVVMGRPAQARDLLLDVDPSASPQEQARAHVVRGLSEAELGDVEQAVRLAGYARRIAPDEPLVALLDRAVAARTHS
ncbi:MAG: hypothetical protein QM747_04735 [Nocardioides sp.]